MPLTWREVGNAYHADGARMRYYVRRERGGRWAVHGFDLSTPIKPSTKVFTDPEHETPRDAKAFAQAYEDTPEPSGVEKSTRQAAATSLLARRNAEGDSRKALDMPLGAETCTQCGMVANRDPWLHEERYGHTPTVLRDGEILTHRGDGGFTVDGR